MQLNLINPFVVFLKLLNKHDRYKLSWRMNDGAALYTNVKLKTGNMKLSEYPGDNLLLFYDMLKPRSYLIVFTPLLKIHETVLCREEVMTSCI